MSDFDAAAGIARAREGLEEVRRSVGRAVVGQQEVVEQLLVALLADGHVLLEGAPGLGKTLLVRSLAAALSLDFGRLQCTPDLMPSDVTGTTLLTEQGPGAQPGFRPGPVFTQVLLVDEINRATPKTQAALLEAMEERRVTTFGTTRDLPDPFLVLATQNPVEMEGTYPLPEAQLDRFLLKVLLPRPGAADLVEIVRRTTGTSTGRAEPVLGADELREARRITREIAIAPALLDRLVLLVQSTHPGTPESAPEIDRFVRYGVSPRGARALALAAKAQALLAGRPHVSAGDLEAVALPALRHRLVLTFEAEAEGVGPDRILTPLLSVLSGG